MGSFPLVCRVNVIIQNITKSVLSSGPDLRAHISEPNLLAPICHVRPVGPVAPDTARVSGPLATLWRVGLIVDLLRGKTNPSTARRGRASRAPQARATAVYGYHRGKRGS